MSRKHGHHDRGPPVAVEAMVEADEIIVRPDFVVADLGWVVVGADAVVVDPDADVVVVDPDADAVVVDPDADVVVVDPDADVVVVDPDADAVVVDPNEVLIAPEIVFVRCDLRRSRRRGQR